MSEASEDWVLIDKKHDLNFSHSDILYINKEEQLQQKLISLAFESDYKWTSKSYNKNKDGSLYQQDYKITDNNSLYTLRCKTIINNANIDDYYDYLRGEYNDNFNNLFCGQTNNSLCSYIKILKCIDKNHQLIHSAFKTAYPSPSYTEKYIYPRDFLYIQSRFKLDSYTAWDGEQYDAVNGSLCYSINYGHPFYKDPPKNYVRGNIVYGGLVLCSLDYSTISATYILCMDYSGDVPYFINNNFILPYKSDEFKVFHDKWNRIVSYTIDKRKDNKNKQKKLKPVFPKTIKHIGGNIDDVINNRNNEVIII